MDKPRKRQIKHYTHTRNQRLNNPPVGLVTPDTDRDVGTKRYSFDPHLDPQLEWAGKAERTSFEVPIVSLHVHERIDPRTIVEAVKRRNGGEPQLSLFARREENPPIRNAIEFYRHKHNWSNRMVAGDSLLIMSSLLEKEGLGGQIQMIYIDPPYGIKYKSNFQPFVNKRNVAESDRDDDLTQEPEMLKAFRDTWELGIHSYVSYLRDRLLLAKDMLHESGSIFVQISDENLHLVRNLLDEVFGPDNFIALIAFKKKKMPLGETFIFTMCDYLVWYGKNRKETKFRRLFTERDMGLGTDFSYVELEDGECLTVTECIKKCGEVPPKSKYFQSMDMRSSGRTEGCVFEYTFDGRTFFPSGGKKLEDQRGRDETSRVVEQAFRARRLSSLQVFFRRLSRHGTKPHVDGHAGCHRNDLCGPDIGKGASALPSYDHRPRRPGFRSDLRRGYHSADGGALGPPLDYV